jgi:hypothetical protein
MVMVTLLLPEYTRPDISEKTFPWASFLKSNAVVFPPIVRTNTRTKLQIFVRPHFPRQAAFVTHNGDANSNIENGSLSNELPLPWWQVSASD